jgi:hypothetical protein
MFKFWKNRKKKVSQKAYDAMVTLLDHYENLTPIKSCPLCVVVKCCKFCPWKIFENMTCVNWFSDINYLRSDPLDYPIQRAQRIEMLKRWIERSKVKK